MMNAISIQNIQKDYKSTQALKGINLEVKQAELFGLIGPDGAGKTSLFRILTSLILPTAGKAEVMGFDVVKDFWQIRKIVGYMPGKFSLYQDLTIEENLNFFATVFNTTVKENYHLIEDIYVQIDPFKKRRAGKLSGGMKQKLALCCALIHQPKVLFLDEPTTGVDPVSRKEFWDMLLRLKEKGISIMVSTPYMDEAERCDRIALMQKGEIMKMDSLKNILKNNPQNLYAIKSSNMYKLLQDLRNYPQSISAFPFGEFHHLVLEENSAINALKNYLHEKGHQQPKVQSIKVEIEDVFIELMQKGQAATD